MGKESEATAMEVDGSKSNDSDQTNPRYSINGNFVFRAQMHVILSFTAPKISTNAARTAAWRLHSISCRRYCTARLRRLYKSLKFTHGRGKYTRRSITEATVTEIRFLHLLLYTAERAWSHAMEKRQLSDGPNARQRIYLIGRLRKAVKWANQFSRLCAAKGDSKTSLEAEAVISEARTQQAASLTEFHWLGHKYPISNAKTRVSILKAQELEKDLHARANDSLPAEKKLTVFDKIFTAYHEARGYIRSDLTGAGNADHVKDDLSGLHDAVTAVLGLRTIERNRLLVSIAKSKLVKRRDDKNEKVTKPEELVRLYDLLLQNTDDLSELVSSRKERTSEEVAFAEECGRRRLAFRAERCFYLAKSYSIVGKRAEAYVLYCHAQSLAEDALKSYQALSDKDEMTIKELKDLYSECRSSSCIEHALGIMEEEKAPENLSTGISALSLSGATNNMKFLVQNLDVYEAALGDPNVKPSQPPRIESFPPVFQSIPRNPIIRDLAYEYIDFPSLENRMKKRGLISRLWGR
ncbi:Signal recognition particle subunit SRP68 [Linum perenne]